MSLTELMAQRAELDRQIAAEKAAKAGETINAVVNLADEAGMPLDELASHLLTRVNKRIRGSKVASKKPVAAKYAQVGGSATWSGRGVQPRWFRDGNYTAV